MVYDVKLSPREVDLLAALVGRRLDGVWTDGWSVELRAGSTALSIVPEEAATPDAAHPTGVAERPKVLVAGEEPEPPKDPRIEALGARLRAMGVKRATPSLEVIAEQLGEVRSVNIISILFGFTPTRECPPTEVLGAVIPAGTEYGWLYFPPQHREEVVREAEDAARICLDVAFELVTERAKSVVVYTHGFFCKASIGGVPTDADWARLGTYSRRAVA